MFPEEIISILEKYKENNTDALSNINKSIESITSDLYSINEVIADETKKLLTDKNTDNNVIELLQDSVLLRKYINTIKIVNVPKTLKHEEITHSYDEEYSEELTPILKIFSEYRTVKLFLCIDNICPICGCNMNETKTSYGKASSQNHLVSNKKLDTYRCPACYKYFVIKDEISTINVDKTNIQLLIDYYNEIPQIDIYTVLVLSNTMHCSLTHNSKDLIAKIPVINGKGEFFYLSINASYCFVCDRFTILKDDFNTIKDTIMCKVIDESAEYQSDSYNDFDIEQKKSMLFQYGYNVQTKRNLSEQQRHIILSSIIEANIITRRDVINHITTLIERGSKIQNWNEATNKWKSDRTFVSEYKRDYLPEIIFSNIILKYKNKLK